MNTINGPSRNHGIRRLLQVPCFEFECAPIKRAAIGRSFDLLVQSRSEATGTLSHARRSQAWNASSGVAETST